MKHFNVTGLCLPGRDYMCDISGKVSQIAAMVQAGTHQLQDGEKRIIWAIHRLNGWNIRANEFLIVWWGFRNA